MQIIELSDPIGKYLESRRRALGLSMQRLALKAGCSEKTVQNYESKGLPSKRQHFEKLDQYLEALGIGRSGVDRLLRGQLPREQDLTEIKSDGQPHRLIAAGAVMPSVFNLGIAASGWVELEGNGIVSWPRLNADWVIIHVSGESMEPRWKDKQYVLFRRLNLDEDTPQVGEDYFFIRNDDHGTFKRLASINEDGYGMRALNPKFPKKLKCSRQEIVMIAEAKFIVNDPPD